MAPNNQHGIALVELALSLTLLLLIVFSITEFGRVMYLKVSLSSAAREGARKAVVTSSSFANLSANSAALRLCPNAGVSMIPTTPSGGDAVKVTVSETFTTVLPNLIPGLNNITIKSDATMRYEN